MKNIKLVFALLAGTLFFQSCLHDARTRLIKREGITEINTAKGKALLDEAWKKHGGDKLAQRKVYSFDGFDTWKDNPLGKLGKLWLDFETKLDFKFEVGTSNSQLTFVDGQRQGTTAGVNNANYYEIENGQTTFGDKSAESNIRAVFGLSHIQYFTEIFGKLRDASIISYAGETSFNDNQYDLIFCTWEMAKPHIEHDQYLLWINQETGLLDYLEYSVREPHVKPIGYKMIGGAIEYCNYKDIDGVLIPHDQIVYPIKKRTEQDKFLHWLRISNFQFDNFDVEVLKPSK